MSYLLDTGVMVHAIRNSRAFQRMDAELGLLSGPFHPTISIISEGELWGCALKWQWGADKQRALRGILQETVILPVDDQKIVLHYSRLERENAGRNLGQNNLWIAATAMSCGLDLLTFDKDFERAPAGLGCRRFDQDSGQLLFQSSSDPAV